MPSRSSRSLKRYNRIIICNSLRKVLFREHKLQRLPFCDNHVTLTILYKHSLGIFIVSYLCHLKPLGIRICTNRVSKSKSLKRSYGLVNTNKTLVTRPSFLFKQNFNEVNTLTQIKVFTPVMYYYYERNLCFLF